MKFVFLYLFIYWFRRRITTPKSKKLNLIELNIKIERNIHILILDSNFNSILFSF